MPDTILTNPRACMEHCAQSREQQASPPNTCCGVWGDTARNHISPTWDTEHSNTNMYTPSAVSSRQAP